MNREKQIVYPYIPNSVPAVKAEMLRAVGAETVDEFYDDVPEALRLREPLDLPQPLLSEYALKRHVEGLLARNTACRRVPQLPGRGLLPAPRAGRVRRGQPARRVPDRLRRRALRRPRPLPGAVRVRQHDGRTAEHGRGQRADLRRLPGGGHVAAHGRADHRAAREALLCGTISPDKLSKIRDYCQPELDDRAGRLRSGRRGRLDLDALRGRYLGRDRGRLF